MLTIIFKYLHLQFYPKYVKNLLTLLEELIYFQCVSMCKPASTSYGLHSFNTLRAKFGTLYLRKLELSLF